MIAEKTPKGLPRPLAPEGDTQRPIPWNMADIWGVGDYERQGECAERGWCQVCGELVRVGMVFEIHKPEEEAPLERKDLYRLADLRGRGILDDGPLHYTCAKLTRAHCATVRRYLAAGEIKEVKYKR